MGNGDFELKEPTRCSSLPIEPLQDLTRSFFSEQQLEALDLVGGADAHAISPGPAPSIELLDSDLLPPEDPLEDIRVSLRLAVTGEHISSQCFRSTDTVDSLIDTLGDSSVGICSSHVLFGGRILFGSDTLANVGVQDGSVVDLVRCRYFVVTAGIDHTAQVWSAMNGECILTLDGHFGGLNTAAFSPDNMLIVTASDDYTARIHSLHSSLTTTLSGHSSAVTSASFSPSGQFIVTASYDGTAKIWSVETGKCMLTLDSHMGAANSAAFSIDGRSVVIAFQDGTVEMWLCTWSAGAEPYQGQRTLVLEGHQAGVNSVVFSSAGRSIVTSSDDHTAKLWSVRTGECMLTLDGHGDIVTCAAFSLDGLFVVTASGDRTARIWDVKTGDCTSVFHGHEDCVTGVGFSSNGLSVVTASDDCKARIWNIDSCECEFLLEGHGGRVMSASFSS